MTMPANPNAGQRAGDAVSADREVVDLAPCPFCGGAADFERRGTGRQSCIVVCTNCGARHESGDTFNSGASWNARAPAPDLAAVVKLVDAYGAAMENVGTDAGSGLGNIDADEHKAGTARSALVDAIARHLSSPSLTPLLARAEALLAVADRATPGPWRLGRNGRDHVVDAAVPQDKGITHTIVTCHGTEDVTTPNALAIAALRDAPALIRDLLAALTGKDGAR